MTAKQPETLRIERLAKAMRAIFDKDEKGETQVPGNGQVVPGITYLDASHVHGIDIPADDADMLAVMERLDHSQTTNTNNESAPVSMHDSYTKMAAGAFKSAVFSLDLLARHVALGIAAGHDMVTLKLGDDLPLALEFTGRYIAKTDSWGAPLKATIAPRLEDD